MEVFNKEKEMKEFKFSKTMSNNGSVQEGEGNGGVQISGSIDVEHKLNASTHMPNGFHALNMVTTGFQVGDGDRGKRNEGTDKNYYISQNSYFREQAYWFFKFLVFGYKQVLS